MEETKTVRVTLGRKTGAGAYGCGETLAKARAEAKRQMRRAFGDTKFVTECVEDFDGTRWVERS